MEEIDQMMALSNLRAISSHSLQIPGSPQKGFMFVSLVRNPSERLISAWTFDTEVQKISQVNFSSYLRDHSDKKNIQSRFLFPSGLIDELDPRVKENGKFKLFRHRQNVFIGVVERYDESMTVLEKLLSLNLVNIDLSYPRKLNQSTKSQTHLIPDVEAPDEYIQQDKELYEFANFNLDLEISLIPNFADLLRDFKARCKLNKLSPDDFNAPISNENWHLIGN
jgi:hypothetical protein